MEITVLQIFGGILLFMGLHGFYKNEIAWSFEAGPGSSSRSGFHIDLTPEEFKYRKEGVLRGKWIRPFSIFLAILGLFFLFIFTGETIAFTLPI